MTRSIPWPRILAEGFAIVVSILLAFGIQAWWEGAQERAEERALLQEIRTTLSEDLVDVAVSYDTITWVDGALRALISGIESGVDLQTLDPDHQESMRAFGRFVIVTVRNGPFETLKARGLDLVSNRALRVSLTTLYEEELPRLIENSEIDQALSRDRMLPYLLEYFELDDDDHWTARPGVFEDRSLAATLARYRSQTLGRYYLPTFQNTMVLMRETLAEIDSELGD